MRVIFFISVWFSVLIATGCHQTKNLNLDFEDVENGLPKNWSVYHQQSGYSVTLDSVNVKSGKYAMAIEFTGSAIDFQALILKLPCNYGGEKITLSGYIKTENVTDGYAGLWLMIDPDAAFDGIELNGTTKVTTGTTDWRRYEITFDTYLAVVKEVVIGGLLIGKGKMWLDDLKVTIDGKDIEKIKGYTSRSFPAKDDKEFGLRSNIVFPELTRQKTDDLELLGRIWGFLKYHHPAIAKGNYNWDYELFRILPAYLDASDDEQRDDILIKWINQYGKISKCRTCQPISDSAFLKPDLSWIECRNINLELKDILWKIYVNRNQGFHYYIKINQFGNPIFLNEETYMGKDHHPDAGFRLLALFRYWNMINYFSPYKHLTDRDWGKVLQEYIPCFIEAESRLEYELTAVRLLGEVCDSHTLMQEGWDNTEFLKGSGQIPAFVKFVENRLVVMETESSELKRGDIITHIEGKSVEAIVDSMKRYYPASNDAAKMRDIARDILRSNKDNIRIEYVSSGKTKRKEISLEQRRRWLFNFRGREDTVQCYKFIGKDIGYINLKTITGEDIPIIKQAFINTKGIIIDIRNYPPNFIIQMLCPYFISGDTRYSRHTRANIDHPGEFVYQPYFDTIHKSGEYYPGKLVVIVNEETQSRAENVAMAFRAGDNTTIIGSATAGSTGIVSDIIFPGGLKTGITGINMHYPDGRETQRVGIVPDIEVKPTIQGIREGRDELLEKAIEIIGRE